MKIYTTTIPFLSLLINHHQLTLIQCDFCIILKAEKNSSHALLYNVARQNAIAVILSNGYIFQLFDIKPIMQLRR